MLLNSNLPVFWWIGLTCRDYDKMIGNCREMNKENGTNAG